MVRVGFLLVLQVLVVIASFGQHHPHDSLRAKPKAILIFMAVDCPVTQKYLNTIKDLASQYKTISITGYFPNGLTASGAKKFRDEYSLPKQIKLVDDKSHAMTDVMSATITPEVFLLDEDNKILYSGAIDNWFFELGRYRPTITEHYLIEAIESSERGELPAVRKTEAIGCIIQGTDNHHHKH